MALKEDLIRQGNLLFRWRSYLPLIIVFFVPYVMYIDITYVPITYFFHWTIFCFAVSSFGLMIRALTIGFVPSGTSGRNTKNRRPKC